MAESLKHVGDFNFRCKRFAANTTVHNLPLVNEKKLILKRKVMYFLGWFVDFCRTEIG